MSGSGREERPKDSRGDKMLQFHRSRALPEWKDLDKNFKGNKGQDWKRKCDYSKELISGGEELENMLLRLESTLGKAAKHEG